MTWKKFISVQQVRFMEIASSHTSGASADETQVPTLPTAFAAPVEEGMILSAAERPPRQSLFDGPSTVFCVAVVA